MGTQLTESEDAQPPRPRSTAFRPAITIPPSPSADSDSEGETDSIPLCSPVTPDSPEGTAPAREQPGDATCLPTYWSDGSASHGCPTPREGRWTAYPVSQRDGWGGVSPRNLGPVHGFPAEPSFSFHVPLCNPGPLPMGASPAENIHAAFFPGHVGNFPPHAHPAGPVFGWANTAGSGVRSTRQARLHPRDSADLPATGRRDSLARCNTIDQVHAGSGRRALTPREAVVTAKRGIPRGKKEQTPGAEDILPLTSVVLQESMGKQRPSAASPREQVLEQRAPQARHQRLVEKGGKETRGNSTDKAAVAKRIMERLAAEAGRAEGVLEGRHVAKPIGAGAGKARGAKTMESSSVGDRTGGGLAVTAKASEGRSTTPGRVLSSPRPDQPTAPGGDDAFDNVDATLRLTRGKARDKLHQNGPRVKLEEMARVIKAGPSLGRSKSLNEKSVSKTKEVTRLEASQQKWSSAGPQMRHSFKDRGRGEVNSGTEEACLTPRQLGGVTTASSSMPRSEQGPGMLQVSGQAVHVAREDLPSSDSQAPSRSTGILKTTLSKGDQSGVSKGSNNSSRQGSPRKVRFSTVVKVRTVMS